LIQKKNTNSLLVVILPQAGIGNKLSVWSRALVIAEKYNIKMYVFGWMNFRPITWISNLSLKRLYAFDFKQLNFNDYVKIFLKLCISKIIFIPNCNFVPSDNTIYIYKKYDYNFSDLVYHRKLIRDSLQSILSNRNKEQLERLSPSFIGVHIRRDDFVKIGYATPIKFFIDGIAQIRSLLNNHISITIYSDGEISDLNEILSMEGVSLSKAKADILDLIEFSKSKILITSIGSSFSYWASFLSDGLVINSDTEWRKYLKTTSMDSQTDEWYINTSETFPSLLKVKITELYNSSGG
jgi:hypothetical protein